MRASMKWSSSFFCVCRFFFFCDFKFCTPARFHDELEEKTKQPRLTLTTRSIHTLRCGLIVVIVLSLDWLYLKLI